MALFCPVGVFTRKRIKILEIYMEVSVNIEGRVLTRHRLSSLKINMHALSIEL